MIFIIIRNTHNQTSDTFMIRKIPQRREKLKLTSLSMKFLINNHPKKNKTSIFDPNFICSKKIDAFIHKKNEVHPNRIRGSPIMPKYIKAFFSISNLISLIDVYVIYTKESPIK